MVPHRTKAMQKHANFRLIASCETGIHLGKELFEIIDLLTTSEGFWNGVLNDHQTNAVRTLPLLMNSLIFRSAVIRRRRRFVHPERKVKIHTPKNNLHFTFPFRKIGTRKNWNGS